MSSSSRAGRGSVEAPRARRGDDLVRERILRAFGERARESGIRAVRMDDLAADLGMSKKTLYQHFRSKEELVSALLEAWVARVRREHRERVEQGRTPADGLRDWGEAWVASVGRFSPAFWSELRSDYPDPYALYVEATRQNRREAARALSRHMRPGLSRPAALELLRAAIERGLDPATAERLHMTQREAMRALLDIWAQGALGPSARKRNLRSVRR